MEKENLIQLFESAITNRNSAEIEKAIIQTSQILNPEEFENYLSKLLTLDWHFSHEDIALTLQQIGSQNSVDALFNASTKKFKYLEYDDSKAFARKCIWAIADIGSNKAKEILVELSKNEDVEIAEYAKKRIGNWNNEIKRKKHFS
jgi:hypothetical protein